MVATTKVSSIQTRFLALATTTGLMANSTKDGGRMESSTEKVSTEKMDVIEEEFGRMAKELSGLMMLNGMK